MRRPGVALLTLTLAAPAFGQEALDLFVKPEKGHCIACHQLPENAGPNARNDVGPKLEGERMIGRFLNHQGTKETITPAHRFGNISVMPEPIWNTCINADQLSFAVEMRSRTGFSGSVVAAYRGPNNSIFNVPAEINTFLWVIGVNWGHILERDTGENTWFSRLQRVQSRKRTAPTRAFRLR